MQLVPLNSDFSAMDVSPLDEQLRICVALIKFKHRSYYFTLHGDLFHLRPPI